MQTAGVKYERRKGNLKKKDQNPHQILNNKGQKLENKDEILKEYARYYKELLEIIPSENIVQEEIERKFDRKIR